MRCKILSSTPHPSGSNDYTVIEVDRDGREVGSQMAAENSFETCTPEWAEGADVENDPPLEMEPVANGTIVVCERLAAVAPGTAPWDHDDDRYEHAPIGFIGVGDLYFHEITAWKGDLRPRK